MDTLKDKVLKYNSIDIDTVSGATLTSKGFYQRLKML